MEHFHGDDDVVFGDETLLENHVRQVCSVNLEPRQWQLAQDPLLQPRYRIWQQLIPGEDQPGHAQRTRSKEEYMQQYVREQGDTLLCNVNRAEKGTVTLDEDQGESSHSSGRLRHRERIRSSRAPKPRTTDGSCLSNSFGEILRMTRRQSQLESEPCETEWSNPSDDMDPR